jgi:hypothetical protein
VEGLGDSHIHIVVVEAVDNHNFADLEKADSDMVDSDTEIY